MVSHSPADLPALLAGEIKELEWNNKSAEVSIMQATGLTMPFKWISYFRSLTSPGTNKTPIKL
jgi:hypothetical protein